MSEHTHTYDNNSNRTDETSLTGQNTSGGSFKAHQLTPGQTLELKGKPYSIVEIISSGTGEASVYKIRDERDEEFVLKLYFEFSNIKEEPNQEALTRIRAIIDPDILLLHDFGVGADKYQGKYCYEITAFAEGGDLLRVVDFKAKYRPDFIERKIVPEIFNGIKKLHKHRIYHCDLKPGNIFYKDAEQTDLVIGDYGSAKTASLDAEQESRKTSTVKGTEAYLAPEQARGFIKDSNDYYSFGMILLHLLYPEQLAKESDLTSVDKVKFEKIVERQVNKRPVIQYNNSFARLNNLIEGLINIVPQNRFGEKEVERWLRGEHIEIIQEEPQVKPIKLGSVTIRDEKNLIDYIDRRSDWYEDLIEDSATFDRFKEWIDTFRNIEIRKKIVEIIKYYQPYGKQFVGEAICRFFHPERDLRIDMNKFNLFLANDRNKEIAAYISKLDEIWKITKREQMRFYLFCLEFSLMQLNSGRGKGDPVVFAIYNKYLSVFGSTPNPAKEYLTSIQNIFNPVDQRNSGSYLLCLFYEFNKDRVFRSATNESMNTSDKIGHYFLESEHLFEDINLSLERERFLGTRNHIFSPTLNFTEFIFTCFADKVELRLEIEDIQIDKRRNYKVIYRAFKTLNSYLKTVGKRREFSDNPDRFFQLDFKGSLFGSVEKESDIGVQLLKEKHAPFELKPENIAAIKNRFMELIRPQLYRLFVPQAASILISVFLIILIILFLSRYIRVGEGWNFFRG